MNTKKFISLLTLLSLSALFISCDDTPSFKQAFPSPDVGECNLNVYYQKTEYDAKEKMNNLVTKLIANDYEIVEYSVAKTYDQRWAASIVYKCSEGIDPSLANVKPNLPEGSCEILSSGIDSEVTAVDIMNELVHDLENGLSGEEDYVYKTLSNPGPSTMNYFEYESTYGHRYKWAAWVPYYCDGAAIKTFISEPVPLSSKSTSYLAIKASLAASGYTVFDHSTEELFTSQGDFVIFTIYYYNPDEISGYVSKKSSSAHLSRLKSASQKIVKKLKNQYQQR